MKNVVAPSNVVAGSPDLHVVARSPDRATQVCKYRPTFDVLEDRVTISEGMVLWYSSLLPAGIISPSPTPPLSDSPSSLSANLANSAGLARNDFLEADESEWFEGEDGTALDYYISEGGESRGSSLEPLFSIDDERAEVLTVGQGFEDWFSDALAWAEVERQGVPIYAGTSESHGIPGGQLVRQASPQASPPGSVGLPKGFSIGGVNRASSIPASGALGFSSQQSSDGSPSTLLPGDPKPATCDPGRLVNDLTPVPSYYSAYPDVRFTRDNFGVNEKGGAALITLEANPSPFPVSVEYSTNDGTATQEYDYLATSGTVIVPACAPSVSFVVPILDDVLIEGNESLNLSLEWSSTLPLSVLGTGEDVATLTIYDDDDPPSPTPTVQFSDYRFDHVEGKPCWDNVFEGYRCIGDIVPEEPDCYYFGSIDPEVADQEVCTDSTTSAASISVTLDVPYEDIVSVDYVMTSVSATPGIDYAPENGTLIFWPGEVTKTVGIAVVEDTIEEPDELIDFALINPVNAALGYPNEAFLTIHDDDADPNQVTLDFLDSGNARYDASIHALNVSNWQTDVELPANSAFADTSKDPDNFRLQVCDPGRANDTSVQVSLVRGFTLGSISYTLNKKQGSCFRGEFLRLVTDSKDDAVSGTQTILVKATGDAVSFSYQPQTGPSVSAGLNVGRPASEPNTPFNSGSDQRRHNIREARIHIVVFQACGCGHTTTEAEVLQDIQRANERLAQSAIRLIVTDIDMGPNDTGVPPPAFLQDGDFDHSIPFVTNPTPDEVGISKAPYKDDDDNSIDVFYVGVPLNPESQNPGTSYPVVRNRSRDANIQNFIVLYPEAVSDPRTLQPYILAHEIMHILLNSPPQN